MVKGILDFNLIPADIEKKYNISHFLSMKMNKMHLLYGFNIIGIIYLISNII